MKNSENENQPAFPNESKDATIWQQGLTKREYYAGLAMQGLLASNMKTIPDVSTEEQTKALASASIMIADEILRQL